MLLSFKNLFFAKKDHLSFSLDRQPSAKQIQTAEPQEAVEILSLLYFRYTT